MNDLPLQYGSVCSGIEAVSLAWLPLGLQPAWFSEIEPFPNAVLAHHYPDVPNLGDMTQIAHKVLAGLVSAPDLLVGGTPCQSFSTAGARLGLSDPRGAITLKYKELANAIDQTREQHRQAPSVIVWENVPGVLYDKSNAFGCLLEALAGESTELQPPGPRWANAGWVSGPRRRIAWRVLDAQHFGLAQRRRRVFLVASGRTGFDPSEVLFERTSLPGHPASGKQQRQENATCPTGGTVDSGGRDRLKASSGKPASTAFYGSGNQHSIDVAASLTTRGRRGDFSTETFIAHSMPQSFTGQQTHALTTANGGKGSSEDGTGRGVPIIAMPSTEFAFAQNARGELRLESSHGQLSGTLLRLGKPAEGLPVIATAPPQSPCERILTASFTGTSPTLRSSSQGGEFAHAVVSDITASFLFTPVPPPENAGYDWALWRVRRLMPVECERLQGMPDNYTLVPYRGKSAADTPRYQAIGNSMAVPCISWLGQRILEQLNEGGSV